MEVVKSNVMERGLCLFTDVLSELTRQGPKQFFALLRVKNMKFVKHGLCVTVETICEERGRITLVFGELRSGLNYEKDIILRRNVKTGSSTSVICRVFSAGPSLSRLATEEVNLCA